MKNPVLILLIVLLVLVIALGAYLVFWKDKPTTKSDDAAEAETTKEKDI